MGPRCGGLLPNGGNPPGKEAPEAPRVIHQPVKGIWIEYYIGPPVTAVRTQEGAVQ